MAHKGPRQLWTRASYRAGSMPQRGRAPPTTSRNAHDNSTVSSARNTERLCQHDPRARDALATPPAFFGTL
eukprot:10954553-Lingulodinium_polyedra.AAC.1